MSRKSAGPTLYDYVFAKESPRHILVGKTREACVLEGKADHLPSFVMRPKEPHSFGERCDTESSKRSLFERTLIADAIPQNQIWGSNCHGTALYFSSLVSQDIFICDDPKQFTQAPTIEDYLARLKRIEGPTENCLYVFRGSEKINHSAYYKIRQGRESDLFFERRGFGGPIKAFDCPPIQAEPYKIELYGGLQEADVTDLFERSFIFACALSLVKRKEQADSRE